MANSIHEIATRLKTKTDAGAVLFDGGDVYDKPTWTITEDEISFAQDNTRIMIWHSNGEWATKTEARKSLKEIRVLVDA